MPGNTACLFKSMDQLADQYILREYKNNDARKINSFESLM
jgi:hypothetical protein